LSNFYNSILFKTPPIFLSFFLLVLGCDPPKTSIHQLKMNRTAKSEGELFYQAYYLRNDTCFPSICQQLNMIIVSSNEFYLNTFFDIYTNGNIREIDWDFSFNNYIPRYCGLELSVCIEDENIYIDRKLSCISELRKSAYSFLFHPDSSLRYLSNKEREIDFFGKIEFPVIPVALIVNGKGKNGLSVKEWKFFFDCMSEIIMVYDKRMNEISLEKWNINYKSLPVEKKEAIWNIAGYNLNLLLDRDCRFYSEYYYEYYYEHLDFRNLPTPTKEEILDIH